MQRFLKFSLAALMPLTAAFAQAADTPFQIATVSELNAGEAFVTFSNTGASSTVAFPTQNGNLCANIYVYTPGATQLSCCSCLVTPNSVVSAPVKQALLSFTDDGRRSSLPATSLAIKMLASTGVATCNAATVGTGANVLATGMVAWSTSLTIAATATPSYFPTRVPFTPGTLSAAELTRMTTICGFNQITGGANVCKGCQPGGH